MAPSRWVVPSRWAALASGVLLEAVAGTPYFVATWLPQLRGSLGFTDAEGQLIASTGNLGMYLSFIWGVSFDRFGPRLTLLFGALASALGYALTALAASRAVPHTVSLLSLYCFIWSSGSGCLDCVAATTTLRNFPRSRGTTSGMLKSLFGLSASLFAIVWGSSFGGTDVVGLLRFLAILVPCASAVGAVGLAVVPPAAAEAPLGADGARRVALGYALTVALCAYVLAVTLSEKLGAIAWAPGYAYALAPFLCAFALLAAPGSGDGDARAGGVDAAPLLEDASGLPREEPPAPAGAAAGATLREAVLNVDFWLLFACLFFVAGTGLTFVNNLGELCASLGGSPSNTAVLVVLFSIGNASGRMAFGAASDRFAAALQRPAWLALAAAAMGVAALGAALLPLAGVFPFVALGGVSYGGLWGTVGPLAADRWGSKALGSILSGAILAIAAGSYALSAGLAAAVYGAGAGADGKCVGGGCFRATFLALCAGCCVAAACAAALGRRMRHVYGPDGAPLPWAAAQGAPPPGEKSLN